MKYCYWIDWEESSDFYFFPIREKRVGAIYKVLLSKNEVSWLAYYGLITDVKYSSASFDSNSEAKSWIESLAAKDGIFLLTKKLLNIL